MSSIIQKFDDSICRACLETIENSNEKTYLFDILQSECSNTLRISDLFQKYTLIAVQENDSLPRHICTDCYTKLKLFHEFCNKCIVSNNKLLEQQQTIGRAVVVSVIDSVEHSFNEIWVKEEEQEIDQQLPIDTNWSQTDHSSQFSDNEEQNVINKINTDMDIIKNETEDNYDLEAEEGNFGFGQSSVHTESDVDSDKNNKIDISIKHFSKSKFECEFCKARFVMKERFDAHMRKHAGLKSYPCTQCNRSFGKSTTLAEHIRVDHAEDVSKLSKFECDYCGKICFRKEALKSHILQRHMGRVRKKPQKNIADMMCEQCGKILYSKAGLKAHIRCKHTHTVLEKEVKCDICLKLVIEANYARHLKYHRNREKNICPICGFGLPTAYTLKRHVNAHTKEIEYPCDMCSKVFYQQWNLKLHKNTVHFGQKRFNCTMCDRSFARAYTLRDHTYTHTGEKRFKCETCGKGFIQRTSFKTHLKTHKSKSKVKT